MTSGIYLIQNKKTGQKYIGQSIDVERRWSEHLRHGKYKNYSRIDNAIVKYGENNFTLSIIEEIDNEHELNEREQYWIRYYNTYKDKNHYNLTPGGDFNPSKNPEIAKKISQTVSKQKKGKKLTFIHKINISKSQNTSGYYRVRIEKTKNCKQGFIYSYLYYDDNGKQQAIRSIDIEKLKRKVEEKKLKWICFDEELE